MLNVGRTFNEREKPNSVTLPTCTTVKVHIALLILHSLYTWQHNIVHSDMHIIM